MASKAEWENLKSFIICTHSQQSDQIKKNKSGGICSTHDMRNYRQ
jgi:hypothetical protein